MKALSIQQPFAWLIVNGFKDIENRKWGTSHRGRILIHAGLRFDHIGYEYVLVRFPAILLPGMPGRRKRSDWKLGGIVGEAEIIDCVDGAPSPWFSGPKGFVMANARPLPFQPCRGRLGFFTPDIDVGAA